MIGVIISEPANDYDVLIIGGSASGFVTAVTGNTLRKFIVKFVFWHIVFLHFKLSVN